MFDRIEKLMNETTFKEFQNLNILLIGIGGVGGYTLECLVRSGIRKITIVDPDTIEKSNLNRQIISLENNIEKKKVLEAKKRAEMIHSKVSITALDLKLQKETLEEINLKEYDYILDACDDVPLKCALIESAFLHHIKLCTCLGTGNRFHPEKLILTKLKETRNDPLAKKIRENISKQNSKLLNTKVVWSEEIPKKVKGVGTFCPVPMSAGALLASYVLNDFLTQKECN